MIKINLTKEILSVLPFIKVDKYDTTDDAAGAFISGNDFFWGGTVVENMMQAWGKFNDHVPVEEFSDEGRVWDKELEDKAWDTFEYIQNNMDDIISIIFYHLPNIKEGVYTRKNRTPGIWEYQPFTEK
jgi:hypothetical protein